MNHHLQQPHSHLPLYEADYQKKAGKKQVKQQSAGGSSGSTRLVSSIHQLVLPAKPNVRKSQVELLSVSPFDSRFPVTISKQVITVSPFDPAFLFKKNLNAITAKPALTLDSNSPVDLDYQSFSPFQTGFPFSHHNGQHRKTRNRSSIKKRKLIAAMKEYRRERGPAAERSLIKKKPSVILEGSVVSFSPWQSVEFCLACDLPLQKLVKDYKKIQQAMILKKKQQQAAAQQKPQIRFKSYSPFDARFPHTVVVPSAVAAFPAYSPLARKTNQPVDFKMPRVISTAPAVALTKQSKVLHTH